MDTQKEEYMQELSKRQKKNAQPTPPTGKVDIIAIREGLAMVMDGLRVMEQSGAKISRAVVLFDGRIISLPVMEVPNHLLGINVMENNEKVFTIDGISVMDVVK